MKNEAEEKLEELLQKGKITEEEFEELKNLILNEKGVNARASRLESVKTVDINLVSIDVKIEGWEEDFVKISEGPERLVVEKEGDYVKIRSKKHGFSIGSIFNTEKEPAKITVLVPKHCGVNVKTVSGDLSISDVFANVKARSVSGDLFLRDISGKINANTVSGDIKTEECKAELYAEAKSGDVKIKNSVVPKGFLKTYSGDISVENSEVSNFDAVLYSGDFVFHFSELKGDASIRTMLGDIRCDGIGESTSFNIETKAGIINLSNSAEDFSVRGEFAVYEDGKVIKKEKIPAGSRLVKESGDFRLSIETKKGDVSIKI